MVQERTYDITVCPSQMLRLNMTSHCALEPWYSWTLGMTRKESRWFGYAVGVYSRCEEQEGLSQSRCFRTSAISSAPRYLDNNALTTLPDGLFQGLTSLDWL